MITLEERLAAIVALLPAQEQTRLNAPLAGDESIDSRLIESVRVLAKSEGLVCMTPGEFTREAAKHAVQRLVSAAKSPTDAPADENSTAALAARLAKYTDPRAQTAFWRSLTEVQRATLLKAK